jgi:Zn-dependent protease
LRQSVRPSPIFLVLVGLTALGGVMAWMAAQNTRPLAYAGVFLFVIAGWVVSLGLPLLFIALGGIGLPGGAVYIRTGLMTPRQRTLVSLAGPLANLVLAVLLLGAARLFYDPKHAVFWAAVAFLGFLQLTALVLNLLPIPGLDGFGALEPHLSPSIRQKLEPVKGYGFLILLVVLLAPGPNRWFFSGVFWLFDLSGVPGALASVGNQLTRFWSAWL